MRIALVAGLWRRVPPVTYGGTTRIVSLLTEELVQRGHDVTLFATGDAQTAARLRAVYPRNLAEAQADGAVGRFDYYRMVNLAEAVRESSSFDIIHCHTGILSIPFGRLSKAPMLHTIMDRLVPDDVWMLTEYPDAAVAARSRCQILPIPEPRRRKIRVVHNGHNFDFYRLSERRGQYLAFLGRMSWEKSPVDAIQVARRLGMPIVLAGEPVFADEYEYFEEAVRPLIDGASVSYIGAVDDARKNEFLGNAAALLFPIRQEEPFGNVMVEAMACGTPVVATSLGPVPEVVDRGKTGYYSSSVDELPGLVLQAMALDRREVREHARRRFSHRRMVDDYLELYRSLGDPGAAAG